jgi:hypothetical protein
MGTHDNPVSITAPFHQLLFCRKEDREVMRHPLESYMEIRVLSLKEGRLPLYQKENREVMRSLSEGHEGIRVWQKRRPLQQNRSYRKRQYWIQD